MVSSNINMKITMFVIFYIKAKLYIIYATQSCPFRIIHELGFSHSNILFFSSVEYCLSYIFDQIICVCRLMCSNSLTFWVTIVIMPKPRGIFLIIDTSGNIAKNGKKYSKSLTYKYFVLYLQIDSLR